MLAFKESLWHLFYNISLLHQNCIEENEDKLVALLVYSSFKRAPNVSLQRKFVATGSFSQSHSSGVQISGENGTTP